MLGEQLDLLTYLPEAVVAVGPDRRIFYANPISEIIFGYGPGELLDQPLNNLIPLPNRAMHDSHIADFAASAGQARLMHGRQAIVGLRRDGSEFRAEASIVKANLHGKPCFVAILRDTTESEAHRKQIAASERKYRAFMENCPDAILAMDADSGQIFEANEAATVLFGRSMAALVGLPEAALHPAGNAIGLQTRFAAEADRERLLLEDADILRGDGSILPVEITARRVEIDGRPALLGFYRDISHRKESEAHIHQALHEAARSSEAKTMFLANMSHELRTPLNGIIGFAEMIAMELRGRHINPAYKEYGHLIVQSAEHLLSLVNDILDISAIDAGKYRLSPEPLQLRPLLEECVQLVAQSSAAVRLRFQIEMADGLVLHADRRSVKQMLLNLLSNAVKFSPEDGWILIFAKQDADGTHLHVVDSGPGIQRDRLQQVLEPFSTADDVYSRRIGGAGLGLSITKGLIELHGGSLVIAPVSSGRSIGAASSIRNGTDVSLHFPPCKAAQEQGQLVCT